MSKIRLYGTSSGYTEIVPKAAAASNTLTAPSTVGELIAKDAAGAIGITSVQATKGNFTGDVEIADTIVHIGDTNTKIRFPSADTITAETSGSERFRITSAGNVGVGDASPGNLLTVAGRTETQSITGHSGTNTDLQIASGHASSNIIFNIGQFGVSATEKLRIDSSGHVNIAGITTAKVFVPTEGQTSHRNLIINGAMQVAQRGTSSTSIGYTTVDRWYVTWAGADENIQTNQHVLTSSDTGPWADGFRYSYYIKNGNQTGGAGATDFVKGRYSIEAQDLAQSGWDYTSSSSYITLSFWMMASVSQDYTVNLTSDDGTDQRYPMKTGVVSANTWTKIIKVIPGNSNIEITNDYGKGMDIQIYPYLGNQHVGGSSINAWSAATASNFGGSSTSTWWTTNDATFEITGMQLEVGSAATPFEHKSFREDLLGCQRYYQEQQGHSDLFMFAGKAQGSTSVDGGYTLNVPMRAQPTLTCGEHRAFKSLSASQTNSSNAPTITSWDDSHSTHSATLGVNLSGHSGFSNNEVVNWCPKSSLFTVDSEL